MAKKPEQEELELDETVGQGNPGDEIRSRLAKQDEDKKDASGEFTDVADEDHEKLEEITEETVEVQDKSEPVQEKKFSIKVNGQTVELTETELIERAQKAESADQRFQEAARLRKEAEQLKGLPKGEPEKPVQPQVTDEDRALARALQMGNEEEAGKVVARLRTPPPAVTRDEVINLTREQINFNTSLDTFREEYPDIWKDQKLMTLAAQMDERMVLAGDSRPYLDRYRDIGEDIKKWTSTFKPTSDKLEKKASLTVVKTSGLRNPAPADEDEDESTQDTISKMAKSRGQQYVQR